MSMYEPLVSVIVPVYNLEKSVARCLESLIKQTYEKIEILVIDDGSTDCSLTVCRKYAARDGRIVVFSKENGGVSSARNLGLDRSNGELVVFVDSDDFVLPDYIKEIVKGFAENDADIVVARFASGDETGTDYHISKEVSISGEYSSIEFERLLYTCKNWYEHSMVMCIWGKGYKREKIIDIRFEGRFAEDYIFTDMVNSHNYRIVVINEIGYVYCNNLNSLTHKTSVLERASFLRALENRLELFSNDKFVVNNTCKLYCNMYIEYFFKVKKSEREQIKQHKKQFDSCINTIKSNHINDKKFFLRMYIFRISPFVYKMLTS